MRICSKCGAEYEHYGQRCSMCRDCKRAYDRAYHANRTKEQRVRKQEGQKARRHANGRRVQEYLLEHPCEICGESHPAALDFDHIDRATKIDSVAETVKRGLAWEKIELEIKKCRVLCANCHRKHTAKQLGWYAGY